MMRVEPASFRLVCDACGTEGLITRQTGDVRGRAVAFIDSHLDPRILAVETVDSRGVSLGWWECTSC